MGKKAVVSCQLSVVRKSKKLHRAPRNPQPATRLFLLLCLIVSVFACPSLPSAEIMDRVIVRVNDDVILLSDVRMRASQLAGMNGMNKLGESEKKEMENKVLEGMIDERLIVQYAKDMNLEISDEEVEKTITSIRKENNLSKTQMREIMKRDGILMDEYEKMLREQKMISIILNQEVNSKVHVEDGELQKYYEENKKEFMTLEEARVRHILLIVKKESSPEKRMRIKKRIEDILNRIRKGEDFVELAKLYSEDGSAVSGGDLGFFKRGKMIKEFEDVAFGLKPGEVSGVVQTDFGYHIIKSVEKKRSVLKEFEEVKPAIENALFAKKTDNRRKAFLQKLKEGAIVERRE